MSQPIQPPLPRTSHHNQGLFSYYYLDNILPQQWHALKDEAATVLKRLQSIYAKFTPNPNNEAQTEDDWIKPVLRELGHIFFDVQVPLNVPQGTQKPDYVFYKDEVARNTRNGKVVSEADLKDCAYAIGDAKKWDRSLDKTSNENDAFNNKNPSYQIFFYMLHSGLPWGILTNERQWRIYHHLTAHKLDVFYEVDLPALLATNDTEEFLYFYAFFRRDAFEHGFLSLEQILTASTEFAQSISDDLRKQVYDVLRYVAQGFFDYSQNGLVADPETCKQIYDNSLTLLYRLLFIFYAEARNLLPLQKNVMYREQYSLYSIKKDIANRLHERLLPTSGIIWPRLKALFHYMNMGSPPLNVTTFNGGLFDPKEHEFLERYVVGDLNLCRAIDKLARVNSQFVDYRDLAIRHLGTIYEGLLEYKLQVAAEPMVELKSSSKIVPAEGVLKKDRAAEFQKGEVYLVTDSGERKVTGSYYTPDYIVKYMVDQAVEPILRDAIEKTGDDFQKVQAVLAVNVLDPSMGSGHFLVEVVEYIARFLVELGVRLEGTDEADMAYWKRRVAQLCIYGIDLNPLAVELAKLSLWLATVADDHPLSFLDHHLRVGNALIGSRLSEIAANEHLGLKGQKKKKHKSTETADLAKEKRFFHWELEFPEIFFDQQGQSLGEKAGFDVVIGNPPYVRQEQLGPDKPYFSAHYSVYHGVADLFVYFFAQGLSLLRSGGRLAYISSNTWLYANYGTLLRQFLRTQNTVETLIDLGNNYIFADAPDLSPSIQIVRKTKPTEEHIAQCAVFAKGERITTFKDQLPGKLFPLSIHNQLDTGWKLTPGASRLLFDKLMRAGKSLGEVVEGRMYYGVKTGLNQAFVIDQETKDRLIKDDPGCTAIIKPVLRGEDLRPWYQENEGHWLICIPNGWTARILSVLELSEEVAWEQLTLLYPDLARYLEPFAEAARNRQDKGQFWWELRPCDYYDAFDRSKIFWPDIAKYPRFSWGELGVYVANTGYFIPSKSYALLGILSSRVIWYIISCISQPLGERKGALIYRLIRQYMEQLPIPPLTDDQDCKISAVVKQIIDIAQQRYNVRQKTARRIQRDLGNGQLKLNQKLEEWWLLSFNDFCSEIRKVFKQDISLRDRDDWEELLQIRSLELMKLTEEIVKLETELNKAIYATFEIDDNEVKLIEKEIKVSYGEW